MRAVVQRVSGARVRVEGEVIAEIAHGLVALVGVADGDTEPDATALADKIAHLRVLADDDGKMNRSVVDVSGSVLVVSQFTLLGDTRKGRRPSFVGAATPEVAAPLVEAVAARLDELGVAAPTGRFGSHMHLELTNDGPVTLLLDTRA